jgi:UDPglucose--hexose-1-phosphate uridylyltransferase
VHKTAFTKPDGRRLILYGIGPVRVAGAVPEPPGGRVESAPHLRWHPLREEWVAYAPARQERTFLPPPEWDPLAPTTDPARPTELPAGEWDVAVFENRFPTLVATPPDPPETIVPTAPGAGACEVVVFTQARTGALGKLPLAHLALVLDVWADRTTQLGERPEVAYVMPFENRGVEVGVTIDHPHGQIYAYPFVPPLPARERAAQIRHFARHGRSLLADHIAAEVADGRRVLHANDEAIAFVPACARYPYEVWIAPRGAAGWLGALAARERRDLARALGTVLQQIDGLWQRPCPYVLVLHQAPTDGEAHPDAHLHFELYPAYRSAGRLKYLAGTEIGAGTFANDVTPEHAAAALRAVPVEVT